MTAKLIGSSRHVNCYLAAWLGRARGVIGATAAIPASLHPTETSCCFRSVSDQLTQLANALFLLGGQGEGRPGILLGNIQTSDDPAPSPQGRDDQRHHEDTRHTSRVSVRRTEPSNSQGHVRLGMRSLDSRRVLRGDYRNRGWVVKPSVSQAESCVRTSRFRCYEPWGSCRLRPRVAGLFP